VEAVYPTPLPLKCFAVLGMCRDTIDVRFI
jgi:hypothetical protein